MAKTRKRFPALSRLLAKRRLVVSKLTPAFLLRKNLTIALRRVSLRWNRRHLAAYVLVSLLLLAYFWPKPSFSELVTQGDNATSNGSLTEAHESYSKALGIKPNDLSLRLRLVSVFEASGNYDLAVAEILKIKTTNPGDNLDEELKRLVELRDQPIRIREDLQKTQEILGQYPDFRDVWLRKSYLNYLLREDEAAKAALDRALELDPNFGQALKLRPLLP